MAQESNNNNTRVFVGKLAIDVDVDALKEKFSEVGTIVSHRLKKNVRREIAYAFINFENESSATKAIEKFNGTKFGANEIEVQIAKEVKKREVKNNVKKGRKKNNNGNNVNNGNNNKNNNGNNNNKKPKNQNNNNNKNNNKEKEISGTTLFVSNLPYKVDDVQLKAFFDGFAVKAAHTVTRYGRSRGYGFVEFENEKAAQDALAAKSKFNIEDREINVKSAYKYDEPAEPRPISTDTLYVSNLPYKLTDEEFANIFKDYSVEKAYVARTKKDRSKGFGFVVLKADQDSAAVQSKIINEKNKFSIGEREILVRPAYLSDANEEKQENVEVEEPEQPKQIALYVSNIPFSINSEALGNLFKDCAGFQSANVVVSKKNERSRGYGFVTFDTEQNRDAAAAAKEGISSEDRVLTISVAKGRKSNAGGNVRGGRRNNNVGQARRNRRGRRGGRGNRRNSNNNNSN